MNILNTFASYKITFTFFSIFFFTNLFSEKPQYWQVISQPLGKTYNIEFSFRQEYRVQTSNFKLIQTRYSFMAENEIASNLNFELHYSYLLTRNPHDTPFSKRHLLEVELNPSIEITKNITFRMRNRYELAKTENEPRVSNIFRQRHQFLFKSDKTFSKKLKNISIYDEVFYNINLNTLTEYRLYPIELIFNPCDKYTISTFLVVRWRKINDHWNPQFIFGSNLDW